MFLKKIRNIWWFFRFHTIHTRSIAEIEKWQENKLRLLLPYLERHIVLYRELLESSALRAYQIHHIDDLPLLPIMRKEMFRKRPVEECIDISHPVRGKWVTTSGSTGHVFAPLRRAIAQKKWYRDSLRYRYLMYERPWRLDATWARITNIRVLPLERKNGLTVFAHQLLSEPRTVVEEIRNFQPYVIEGHASLVFELARAALHLQIPLRPRYVIVASEYTTPAMRTFIEDVFKAHVRGRYGLEEFGTVGFECPAHDGFHINAESFIVEVVDSDGNPLPTSTPGRILVTDLYNFEMPFVRYETGDWGKIERIACSCGLETPRLFIEGRYAAFLTFPERSFHQFEFSEIAQRHTQTIVQYQIVKKDSATLLVRIVPSTNFTVFDESVLKKDFERLIGPTIRVSIEHVSKISRLPRGKSQIIVDETHHASFS